MTGSAFAMFLVRRTEFAFNIGHFGKYHNTLCLSPQSLHKHCFCFLLGPLYVPRGTGNNAYVKFGGTNKEYYGIFRSGLLVILPFIAYWTLFKFLFLSYLIFSEVLVLDETDPR